VDARTGAVGQPHVIRGADGELSCSCGDRLADRVDGMSVVIDGVEFSFRRRSDEMICRSCGFPHPAWTLWSSEPPQPADTGQRRRRDD
jgi:hypothetical protein